MAALNVKVPANFGLVAVQFHDADRKNLNHQGHEVSRRLLA
jgi:hypothetical protein